MEVLQVEDPCLFVHISLSVDYSHTDLVSLSADVASPASPPALSHDDGGFSSNWVNHQEHQLGPLQTTEETRREIQEMPSDRPPVEDDDDEESEC